METLFKIADEEFLELGPCPELPKMAIEPIERPGVDGAAFWELGIRGPVSTVRTKVDCNDIGDALDTYDRYRILLQTGSSVDVMFGGQSLADFNCYFQILDVRIAVMVATANSTGGLSDDGLAWLECDWTLKAVPVPEEDE